jgi:hypothetical protein
MLPANASPAARCGLVPLWVDSRTIVSLNHIFPAARLAAVFSPLRGARAAQTRPGFRRGLSNLTGGAIGTVCPRRCRVREPHWCVSSAAAGLGEQRRVPATQRSE